jgi:beta-galactosidase
MITLRINILDMNIFNGFLRTGCMLLSLVATAAVGQNRVETYLSDGWRFSHFDKEECALPSFNDSKWEVVSVPHDWAIAGPFDKKIDMQTVAITQNGEKKATEKTGRSGSLPWIGSGWYRKQFEVKPGSERVLLQFDGAMSEPVVYVNGKEVGHWAYGYSCFYFDITPYISTSGKNLLAVHLQNVEESSRWYPGAGIYRPVRLIQTRKVAVANWGTKVTTPVVTTQYARVEVENRLTDAADGNTTVGVRIFDAAGHEVAKAAAQKVFSDKKSLAMAEIPNPRLWSPESPALYKAVSTVYQAGEAVDEVTTTFGIRTVRFSAEKGFQLNGVTRKIKGVCLHHDLGPLGAAVNKAALLRQLLILKEMGCDAIRTSHNMPSPWQMEICDSLGMMVMAESFDMWNYPKVKNGYSRFFKEWSDKDMENLVLCNINHPSIIMWSIGNEIPEQWSADGARTAKHLQDICHSLDATRPCTTGMDQIDNAVKSGFATLMDIPGINYRDNRYEDAYKNLPQGFILGSETASTVSSRGVYKFPVVEAKGKKYADGQCSSYDLEACPWSNIPEVDWWLQDDKPWVVGEFVWTGFDYLGEPTPYDEYWPSRSSYFGICDLAGLPKDRYYLYRSRWNTQKPTLHLLPHWTWPGREGQVTPVYCYTSFPSAELFVNGVSQGRRTKDASAPIDRYRLRWNEVKYEPGTLKVVAYDSQGNKAGEEEIRTAGNAVQLRVTADKETLTADGNDLMFLTISAMDKDGNLCPTADNELSFKVSGTATFRGVCNGDATSTEVFTQPRMKLFNGQLVLVVQSTKKKGVCEVTVSGKGLKSQKLSYKTM